MKRPAVRLPGLAQPERESGGQPRAENWDGALVACDGVYRPSDRRAGQSARPGISGWNDSRVNEVIRPGRSVVNGLTPSVTVDRRARLLALGALIAAALMLSLSAFSTSVWGA